MFFLLYLPLLLLRVIRNTFLFTALSLLMLHAVVPHHHAESAAACQIEEQSSTSNRLFLFLSEAFHQDFNDKHHLEEFGKADYEYSVFLTAVPVEQESIALEVNTGGQTIYAPLSTQWPPPIDVKQRGRRGPPRG